MPSTFRDPKAYNELIRGVLLAIRLGANFHFFLVAKHSPHSSSIAFPSTFPFHAPPCYEVDNEVDPPLT